MPAWFPRLAMASARNHAARNTQGQAKQKTSKQAKVRVRARTRQERKEHGKGDIMAPYVKRPWDEFRFPEGEREAKVERETKQEEEARSFDLDMKNIGKHALFGLAVGALTGAGCAAIELLRDPKAMAAGKRALATKRMGTFSAHFGLYFAAFHGIRKSIQLYVPKTSQDTTQDFLQVTAIAGVATMAPVVAVPRLRYMIPYGVFLIVIDSVNSLTAGPF